MLFHNYLRQIPYVHVYNHRYPSYLSRVVSNFQPHVSSYSVMPWKGLKTVLLENLFHLSNGRCREVGVYDYIVSNEETL